MKKIIIGLLIILGISHFSCTRTKGGYIDKKQYKNYKTRTKYKSYRTHTYGAKRRFFGEKLLIAVMDFKPEGVSLVLANKVSELIRNELINSEGYTVVERSQMNMILKEQAFQQTGCTDVSCAVQIGKLVSAKKIMVGKVMQLGTQIIISGRIVDVEKGVGEKAANAKAASQNELFDTVSTFTKKLTGNR